MKANEYISIIKEKTFIFVTSIHCKLWLVDSPLNCAEYCIQTKPFTDYACSKYTFLLMWCCLINYLRYNSFQDCFMWSYRVSKPQYTTSSIKIVFLLIANKKLPKNVGEANLQSVVFKTPSKDYWNILICIDLRRLKGHRDGIFKQKEYKILKI